MTIRIMILPAALASVLPLLASCGDSEGRRQSKGFRLPEGDVAKGKEVFVSLGCYHCHTVEGVELPEYAREKPLGLHLGGEVVRVRTYGELVTSVINPDHIVSYKFLSTLEEVERAGAKADSPMPHSNHRMTVAQLIDLVGFLQSTYEKMAIENDHSFYLAN